MCKNLPIYWAALGMPSPQANETTWSNQSYQQDRIRQWLTLLRIYGLDSTEVGVRYGQWCRLLRPGHYSCSCSPILEKAAKHLLNAGCLEA